MAWSLIGAQIALSVKLPSIKSTKYILLFSNSIQQNINFCQNFTYLLLDNMEIMFFINSLLMCYSYILYSCYAELLVVF